MLMMIIITLVKIAVAIGGLMTAAAYFVLLERWMAAWVQDRVGPNRVGVPLSLFGLKDLKMFGLGQPAADGLKIILKEDFTPSHVDKPLFILAPLIILSAALSVFAVVPFGDTLPPIPALGINEPIPLVIAPGVDVGMLYVFALSSVAVYGVILGGWASNNKYSFLGALRSSAQLIAYELPLGLGILGIVLATGSLRLDAIMEAQANHYWFMLAQPLGMIVFVIAAFAEAARLPFDLPEAEQELIGGYHTEYAGMKLLLFLVGEFLHMITASFLIAILFLGGWHLPFGLTGPVGAEMHEVGWGFSIWRVVVLMTKIFLVIVFFMLVRWSWPRFRFDQLMSLAWKVMLPLGMVNLAVVACLAEASRGTFGGALATVCGGWAGVAISWVVFLGSWALVAWIGPLVTDNRPRRGTEPYGIDPQI